MYHPYRRVGDVDHGGKSRGRLAAMYCLTLEWPSLTLMAWWRSIPVKLNCCTLQQPFFFVGTGREEIGTGREIINCEGVYHNHPFMMDIWWEPWPLLWGLVGHFHQWVVSLFIRCEKHGGPIYICVAPLALTCRIRKGVVVYALPLVVFSPFLSIPSSMLRRMVV